MKTLKTAPVQYARSACKNMAARSTRSLERVNAESRARARSREAPMSRMPTLTENVNEHLASKMAASEEKRAIFLDLENLAFLGGSLQPLQMRCKGVEFRAYTSPDHPWASRATHIAASNAKEAADVRMVLDASKLLHNTDDPVTALLIITDDQFGATLAAEEPAVAHVTYSSPLPLSWRGIFRGADQDTHMTVESFFATHDVFREKVQRGRSESIASGTSGRSRSASFTRASWSRQLDSDDAHSGFSDVAPHRPSKKSARATEHFKQKLDAQRNELESLRVELQHLRVSSHARTGGENALRQQVSELHRLLDTERARSAQMWAMSRESLGAGARAGHSGTPPAHASTLARDLSGGRSPSTPRTQRRKPKRRPGRRWPAEVQPSPGKVVGTFKWFDPEKGYGFIAIKDGAQGTDLFVHTSNILCAGEPGRYLENWDVELRVAWNPRKSKSYAAEVSGPSGRLIPVG